MNYINNYNLQEIKEALGTNVHFQLCGGGTRTLIILLKS